MLGVALLLAERCAPYVIGELSPRPQVALGGHEIVGLRFGSGVRDSFRLSAPNGLSTGQYAVTINDWQKTLSNAFNAAFDGRSAPESEASASTPILQIIKADLSYGGALDDSASEHTQRAQIQYRAELVDAGGAVLATARGMARTKPGWQPEALTKEAVEVMYQDIAAELFKETP